MHGIHVYIYIYIYIYIYVCVCVVLYINYPYYYRVTVVWDSKLRNSRFSSEGPVGTELWCKVWATRLDP